MTRICLLILVCGILVITSAETTTYGEPNGSSTDTGPTPQSIGAIIVGAISQIAERLVSPGPHLFGPSVSAFSLDVLKSLSKSESPTENILFSSSSLYKTLLAVYLGSSGEGKTNLARTLHLESVKFDVKSSFEVWRKLNTSIVREGERLFYDQDINIKENFKTLLQDDIMGLQPKDPSSEEVINNWATGVMGYENNITEFIRILSMKLLPISLAFSKYDLKKTYKDLISTHMYFSVSRNNTEYVDSMERMDHFKYYEHSSLKTKIISIPYQTSQKNFVILLPDQGQTVKQLIDSLTVDTIENILQNLENTKLVLQMPQINTEQVHNITKMCQTLKICELLKKDNNYLQGMTSDTDFFISDFIQKTRFQLFTDVDVPVAQPVYPNVPLFSVSRPFMYMVYDNQAKMPKILGTMMNPKQ